MSTRGFLVAAGVAVLLSVAWAWAEPCKECRTGLGCATNLSRCVVGDFSSVHEGDSDNSECSLYSGEIWFACLSSNQGGVYDCFYTGNCSQPFDQCQCRNDIKCYTSDEACRNQQGALTPESGTNTDCLALGRPVYSCWEVPEICRNSETCKIIPRGGGNQDPHFVGFDGQEWYFEGKSGQDYNILSDDNLQVNAHFIRLAELKGTYMGRLGVLFGGNAITFDPHFGVFYNDTLMTEGEVETPEASFAIETVDRRFRFTFVNDVYQFVASVAVEKGVREAAYINIKASIIGVPSHPHGILGQTARIAIPKADPLPKPFQVEGAENDYCVRDGILGRDFTFNRFVGDEQPVTVMASRFQRSVASLFEANVE